MKKVLIVTTIGGFVPQFEMGNVRILQEMGFEVHYASNFKNKIYTYEDDLLKKAQVHCHHIDICKNPMDAFSLAKAYNQLVKIMEEEQISFLHCHNPVSGVLGRMVAHRFGKERYVIYTAHGFHFYRGAALPGAFFYKIVEKQMAKKTDMIITINQEDYLEACKFQLKKNGCVELIHGVGVDTNRFCPNPMRKEEARQKLGIPDGVFHIVTAAEVNENKNQRVVIEAIRRLPYQKIYYSVCGKGPLLEKLEKLVKKYGLEDRIHFLGFRTDMEFVLQSADVFTFSSIREGLGIAAIEALLCGVPLIVSDNRGTREYARNNENAIVCQKNSVEEYASAITQLISNSSYRERLAQNSRESALLFSKEKNEEMMRQIYKRALSKMRDGGEIRG